MAPAPGAPRARRLAGSNEHAARRALRHAAAVAPQRAEERERRARLAAGAAADEDGAQRGVGGRRVARPQRALHRVHRRRPVDARLREEQRVADVRCQLVLRQLRREQRAQRRQVVGGRDEAEQLLHRRAVPLELARRHHLEQQRHPPRLGAAAARGAARAEQRGELVDARPQPELQLVDEDLERVGRPAARRPEERAQRRAPRRHLRRAHVCHHEPRALDAVVGAAAREAGDGGVEERGRVARRLGARTLQHRHHQVGAVQPAHALDRHRTQCRRERRLLLRARFGERAAEPLHYGVDRGLWEQAPNCA